MDDIKVFYAERTFPFVGISPKIYSIQTYTFKKAIQIHFISRIMRTQKRKRMRMSKEKGNSEREREKDEEDTLPNVQRFFKFSHPLLLFKLCWNLGFVRIM